MIYGELVVVYIVEYILKKRTTKELCSMGILALISAIGAYFVPYMAALYIYLLFVYNHFDFLKSEKLFFVLITVLFGLASLRSSVAYLPGVVFIVCEYILVRIMQMEESRVAIYQNKLMKQQVEEIQTMYMTMRGWRHDYHNHLQSLKGYLQLSQVDEARNYLNDLEQDLDSIDTLYHSGNIQIDAILNSKLAIAEHEDIEITCDANVPSALSVNEIDLCVIIGNLLDNAIESCRKVEDHPFIRVYVGVLKQQLYISITNSTSETVRVRTDAYFSTKRGDHGHGLRRVDNAVKKYDGYLNRQNEPGVFATEIILPL